MLMRGKKSVWVSRIGLLALSLCATSLRAEEINGLWDRTELFQPPIVQTGTTTDSASSVVTTVTFTGLPYKGAARTYSACLAVPKKLTGKAPAVVLVHGGAGTSFPQWATQWADKGYVAIAPDVNFLMDSDHMFMMSNSGTAKDMWTYHAMGAVIGAVSAVAQHPQVDADRIAMMGISWGGYLTCIAAPIDKRIKAAISVYGCGYFDDAEPSSGWHGPLVSGLDLAAFLSPAEQREWIQRFDCKQYLPMMDRPILFGTGTSDGTFPMNTFEKSLRLPTGKVASRVIIEWGHDYSKPWASPEFIAFADQYLNKGAALVQFSASGTTESTTWATYTSDGELQNAGLVYTTDTTKEWRERNWSVAPAKVDKQAKKISATLPDGAVAWFINATDSRGYTMSSLMQIPRKTERAPLSQLDTSTRLSTAGWTASSSAGMDTPAAGIDGLLRTRACRGGQHAGDFYQVDMGAPRRVSALALHAVNGDWPQKYAVSVSSDGSTWGTPVATGEGSDNNMQISFPPQTARYLKIELTADAPQRWWSVVELELYGSR